MNKCVLRWVLNQATFVLQNVYIATRSLYSVHEPRVCMYAYLLYEIFLRGFHTVVESEILLNGVHLVLAELTAALCHLVRHRERRGGGKWKKEREDVQEEKERCFV